VGSGGNNVYYDSWSNVGVEEGELITSSKALLSPNHPNPFVSVTKFAYSIPENSMVDIRVYNALGQEMATLVHEQKSAGTYNVTWNAVDENGAALPKGIYFLKLATGNLNATRKLILD
jgi:flagellar hook assembly protein FlgD